MRQLLRERIRIDSYSEFAINTKLNSLFLLDLERKAIQKPYVFIANSLYEIRYSEIRYSGIRYSEFYRIRYSDPAFQKHHEFIAILLFFMEIERILAQKPYVFIAFLRGRAPELKTICFHSVFAPREVPLRNIMNS